MILCLQLADCNSNMKAIKINSKFDSKCSNNSAAIGLNFQPYSTFSYLKQRFILASCKHRIILCHWFVAKTSKYRELFELFVVFMSTIEATVLKVIRIFLYQPVGKDKLVILNIFVTLITCKSIVVVNFNKQKLNNSKKSGKTDR